MGILCTTFNYQFDIQFENKQTELRKGRFVIKFANGEILNHDDPGYFEQPSRPNKMEFQWITDGMLYTGHFYFDEEELKKHLWRFMVTILLKQENLSFK